MSFSFGTTGAPGGGFGSGGTGAFGSTGGGFGAAPAAGGAAASPFGGGAATGGFGSTGTSAFGGGGATGGFGSAIKPTATGFGSGGGFGTTATTGGGMFGAQPAATGGFGAAPAGGGLFGSAAASPGGGFGAASPTGFGAATTTTGGFGSTGNAFGGGATTGFGAATGASAFGNNAAASPFGAPKAAAASPFGQTSGFGATSAFGSGGATGFGTPAPAAGGSVFGGGAGTSAFGAKSPSPFGAAPTTSAFGAAPAAAGGFGGFGAVAVAPAQPQVGTGTPPYELTREQDGAAGVISYHTITRMQSYAHKSLEELRWEDYVKRTNPQQAQAIAALNQPQAAAPAGGFGATGATQPTATGFGATGGFGPTTSAFGAAPTSGGFGSSFGTTAPAATSSGGFGGFGSQTSTGSGMFGSTTRSLGFGATTTTQPATSAFGASPSPGFGAPATGGFGSTGSAFGTSSFGAPVGGAAQPATGGFGGFGSTATGTTGGFGATTGGAFGKPTATPGGFGFGATTQQLAPATGGFFGQNTGAAQQPAGGSLFGGTNTAATGSGFSFGGSTPKPTTSTGFGGFGTNTTTAGAGGFGTGGGFGSTGGFGTGGTGGFGATTAPTQAASGSSLFGGTSTGAAGGFGFATNSSGAGAGASLFGSTPKTGTGMFGSTATATGGGGLLYGSTATRPSSLFGGGNTANKGTSGFNFGGGGGLTATTGTSSFGSFGSFGSGGTTTAPATGGFGGGSLFGSTQAAPATAAAPQPQQPSILTAAPDVNPYGTGAFGAGLVEQNVKAALDSQSLKPSSSAASRLSTFAQDVGLPRGPLENSVASKRNLLSSNRYSIPVSFIRESGFKGTKSRFATITSASAASAGGNALRTNSSDAVTGNQDDDFKFSSSLFRNSVAKRLVINKTDLRHDSSSARSGSSRASVIPLSEDDAATSTGVNPSRNKVPLKPDDEGYYSVVFRTLTNKKSFTLRLKRVDTVKEARDDVKRLLRSTMSSPVSAVQLLVSGRVVHDSTMIADLNLLEGDVVDVAIVEDFSDGNGADRDHVVLPKKSAVTASDSLTKPQPSRFVSYAEFMNSAMREEQEQHLVESHKPVSTACPGLKNEDYYTVPSYDRLKRMTEEELSAVEGFTVGCKGLGSVEWIGKIDVRHLDLDELIHFEKKEVIVYKDDENKHELGTGLNRPAIVELLGIFPPRKVQDPEAYKEKVKQRTRDIGSTYIDYTPSTGIWRFRVEHFSRYGFDDDDEDEDMEMSVDPMTAAGFGDDRKKMAVPKRQQPVVPGRGFVSSDRVNLVRNSAMYRNQSQFASRTAAVSSFRDRTDEFMTEELQPSSGFTPSELTAEPVEWDVDHEAEAPLVVHNVPTSIVFAVAPELLNIQPLGIDTQTSLLPIASKSTTYQLFLQVANQPTVARNQADPGLFLARSFRCSWGPNGELVNIGRPRTVSSGPAVGRTVTVEFPLEQRSASPSLLNKDALELHYECCQSNVEESDPDVPVNAFTLPSDDGVVRCLRKYAEFAERTRKQYPASRFYQRTALLWKLVQALWGQEHDVSVLNSSQFCPLAARDDPREVESMETFQMVDLRREAISKWFEDALRVEIGSTNGHGLDSPSEEGVLELLCQHRIVEAAEMAMECGDFRLSTLISQAASYEGSDFRTLLADQLSQWSENSTLEYVEEDIVMIYSLLAGSVEVLTSKKASDMSWLMCLALFFWYKRGPATSLKTALTLYREAVTKSHAKGPASESAQEANKDDVIMEVMKLYVEEAVSLCSVLSPSGFPVESNGDEHLDYELSWHLHSVLRAIGFRIERKWESHIHHNYIRQLEGAGLWEEAIYVSLNISDVTERVSTCRELLQRNADLLRTAPAAKRVELCDKYALPMEWIDEALAMVAVSKHQYYEEIAHWMAARQYEEAHACLVRHIAPTCLFSGEKDVLLQLLVEMEPHAVEISQWTSCGTNYVVGGGLVLEYLRLEDQQGIEAGGEVEFLGRLMDLAEQLSLARGSVGSRPSVGDATKAQHQRNASELLVARTALSSMLVTLSTRAIQLRALLDKQEDDQDQDDDEQSQGSSFMSPSLPYQLQPDFLTSLSGLARGRETKFVESYRASQLLRLCASFVDWRA